VGQRNGYGFVQTRAIQGILKVPISGKIMSLKISYIENIIGRSALAAADVIYSFLHMSEISFTI